MEYDQAQLNRQVLRIPLATQVTNRDQLFSKDAQLLNCFTETTANGQVLVRKRPGLSASSILAYPSGFATGQGMAYYAERFYAIAGNTLYRLGAAQTSYSTATTWSNLGPGSFGNLGSMSYVVFRGQILLIGGITGLAEYSNGIWASNDGLNWAQIVVGCPWGQRYTSQVVVANEKLYLFGGFEPGNNPTNDVWVSDDGSNWSQLTASAPWSARAQHRVVWFNNTFVLMGGNDGAGTHNNEVWTSVDGVEWTQRPDGAWADRSNFGVYVYNNRLYVVGGNDAGAGFNNSYYTSDGLAWTLATAAAFATARFSFGYAVYDNKLWAVGGIAVGPVYKTEVYSSTDGATWTLVTAAPGFTGRGLCACVTFQTPSSVSSIRAQSLWLIGGDTGGGKVSDVYYATINAVGSTSFPLTTTAPSAEPMQFTEVSPSAFFFFKNTYNAWALWGNSVVRMSDTDYPARTVPGVVYLNQRVFVMTPEGVLQGSDLAYPLGFNPFNYVEAEYEPDKGKAIAKYLNYIVAFGERTVQFFYDNGSFTGNSISPQQNMVQRVGCVNGYTVANINNTLIFLGRGEQGGMGFYILEGGKATKISTEEIDRFVGQAASFVASVDYPVFSAAFQSAGHHFYLCTCPLDNITLAYDMSEGRWHLWNYNNIVSMPFSGYATDGIYPYFQYSSGNTVYIALPTTYGDAGVPITCQGVTDPVDFDTYLAKFLRSVTVVGDRNLAASTSLVNLSWTDDDYLTYSTPVAINLNQGKPWTWRCGRFYKRAFKWTHSNSSTPLRLKALELQVDFGNV